MSRADGVSAAGFLSVPATSSEVRLLFDKDLRELGFVMNASRLWAYQPETRSGLFELLAASARVGRFDHREVAILVAATASTLGDSYCSLAWGRKLARATEPEVAASVLRGDDRCLSPTDAAMARWARCVVEDPNRTTRSDVQQLRHAGFDDVQIFAMTVIVALRLAFSIVNDALGATPDSGLRPLIPDAVLDAVTFGRAIDPEEPL